MPERSPIQPRRWATTVLLLVALPTIAAVGTMAAFFAFSAAALRLADDSVAWSVHASTALAEHQAVAALLDVVARGENVPPSPGALEHRISGLRGAVARGTEFASGFGEEELAEERRISELAEELIALARTATVRPSPEAVEACRRLATEELLPKIDERVREEHAGAAESAARLSLYARTLSTGAALGLVLLVSLAALLFVAVRRRVFSTVEALAQGAQRFGAGELSHRIAYDADDELGALARAFNEMAEALEQSMVSRHRLEAQVEERTALLVQARTDAERRLEELKEAQTKLVASERLSAIGMLAASVAHEINNPLAFVLANVEFALEAAPALQPDSDGGAGEVRLALQEASEGARRVRDIVKELKAFSRGGDSDRTDLREAILTTLHLAANEIRHRATIEISCDAQMPLVRGNVGRFGQVVLNLVMNALEAMPTRPAALSVVKVRSETTTAGWACFEVEDNGCGMSRDVMARLFEPFFSTKAPHLGTGLGLSICRSIVEQSGGTIRVRSEPGVGTTFRVEVPPASEQSALAAPLPSPVSAPRRLRVLVIDDEPLAGRAAARALKGHEVETVLSGPECLALLEAGARFDAIVCDLMMPLMSGPELLEELERLFPAQARRLLFLTGGAFTAAAVAFLERSPVVRLGKPFEAKELQEAVLRVAA